MNMNIFLSSLKLLHQGSNPLKMHAGVRAHGRAGAFAPNSMRWRERNIDGAGSYAGQWIEFSCKQLRATELLA
jgi:hypothetical protein